MQCMLLDASRCEQGNQKISSNFIFFVPEAPRDQDLDLED